MDLIMDAVFIGLGMLLAILSMFLIKRWTNHRREVAVLPFANEIVYGTDSRNVAVTLRPLTDPALFKSAESVIQPEAVRSQLGAMLQAAPGILVAKEIAGSHLMEVVIDGDLIRASDGVGFRAMARGPSGEISEHARL